MTRSTVGRFARKSFMLALLAVLLATTALPPTSEAAQGDCAQPLSSGTNPTASDCLFILRSSVGLSTCSPTCICDPNGAGGTTATDALVCLAKAVGQPVTLNCPCATDEATLGIVVNPDPARAGEILDVELTVTNSGTTDLTGVQVDLLLPAELADFFLFAARGASASCVGPFVAGTCSPGETVRWAVGDLDSGETIVLSIPPPVDLDPLPADGTEITFQATVSAATVQLAAEETSVFVDSTRALDLALDEDRDPVAPGEQVLYRLSFGNAGAALSPSTVLRMPLPEGTSFVSASDGGVLGTGDVIEWTIGTLSPGDTGVREVIVDADGFGTDGGAISAAAEIENQAGELVSVAAATQVTPDIPLVVTLGLVPDPVEAGEVIAGTVTVANEGAVALLDVTVEVRIPEETANFFLIDNSGATVQCLGVFVFGTCSVGEVIEWTVGTLEAGAGITLTMPPSVAAATEAGTVVSFEARARDGSGLDVAARESVRVVDPPVFDIAIEDDVEPVEPGGQIRYLVSFGNAGATLGEDPVLRVAMPAGVTIVEASEAGVIDADNVVEWDLATFAPGETDTRTIVVDVDETNPLGTILSAEATIDAGTGERARAVNDTRVEADVPLKLAMDLYSDPSKPGETLDGVITVTNVGLVPLLDVEVEVILPQETLDFFLIGNSGGDLGVTVTCAGTFVFGTCSANERVIFAVGDLEAGSGVVLTTVPKIKTDVPPGSVVTFAARARATGGIDVAANRSVRVMDDRQLELSLDDGEGDPTIGPSSTIYRLTYGNPTAALAEGGTLQATVPEGTVFAYASDGGALLPGGIVRWLLDPLAPGDTGTRDLILDIDGDHLPGDIVRVEAEIDDDSNGRTRAVADTRIEDGVPLLVTMDLGADPVVPGKTVDAVLTATNTGLVPLLDVEVEVLLPQETGDFFLVGNSGATSICAGTFVFGTCSRDERVVFTVGTLEAGAGITLTTPVLVAATTPAGTVMTLEARGRATDGVNTAARGSVRVESEKLFDLSLDDGDGDAVLAGAELVYTINFGNPTAGLAEDSVLSILLPLGTTFVAASDGGAIDVNGFISWDVGTLAPGDVGTRTLTVDVDGALADGAIVSATVQMDDSSGRRTHAQSDTRIETDVPLTLTLELDPDEAAVGEAIVGTLVVTNTGLVTLAGVEVEVMLPEEEANFALTGVTGATAVCAGTFVFGTCSAGERVVYTVGDLAAGADATLTFPPGILAGTPAGTQVVFEARARATGGANVALRDTVRVVAP